MMGHNKGVHENGRLFISVDDGVRTRDLHRDREASAKNIGGAEGFRTLDLLRDREAL